KPFRVWDLIGYIDGRSLDVLGDAALANALGDRTALGLQFAAGKIAVEGGAQGVDESNAHLRVLLLEGMANTGQGTSRADGADKSVHLAVGLAPDLRARGAVVARPVGQVVELIGPDGAVRLRGCQFLGQTFG